MKKTIISILLSVCLIFSCMIVFADNNCFYRTDVKNLNDNKIQMDFIVSSFDSVYGAQIFLNFNKDALDAKEIIEGDILNPNDTDTELVLSKIDNDKGVLSYVVTKVGEVKSTKDSGILFSVIFEKKNSSEYNFKLENNSIISDKLGTKIDLEYKNEEKPEKPEKPQKPDDKDKSDEQEKDTNIQQDKKIVEVEVNLDDINKQLENKESEKVIIETDEDSEEVVFNIPSDIMLKIKEEGKSLEIKSKDAVINIQKGTFSIKEDSTIELIVKNFNEEEKSDILNNADTAFKLVSQIFEFNLNSKKNGKIESISQFEKPITITLNYDLYKVNDARKLGAYHYNNTTNKWDYMGGSVKGKDSLEFSSMHFSKYTVMEYNKTFKDVNMAWAKDAIEVLASRHIVDGIDSENFAPNNNVTRAQFAKILVYGLDLKEGNKQVEFNDVTDDAWYSEPVNIAASLGIVTGYEGKFDPNNNITREQMASMIVRALKYVDKDTIYNASDLKFTDEQNMSSWAKEDVAIACELGLLQGIGNNKFDPKNNASRAQAAVVLFRLINK